MTKALATNDIVDFAMAGENIQHLWCRWLIGVLRLAGADQFVVSPGYRCSPLLYALHQGGGGRAVWSQRDERAAGYFALGLAKAGVGIPVLICTSGTAMANYYPAVIEAYSDRLPLVILSADRPFELHDCGANQTIRQSRLFGDFTVKTLDLPEPTEAVAAKVLWQRVTGLVAAARHQQRPVHINLPLREPLEPVAKAVSKPYLAGLSRCGALLAKHHPASADPAPQQSPRFAAAWQHWHSQDINWLVVVGGLPAPQRLAPGCGDALAAWLRAGTAPIYCDVTANLKAQLGAQVIADPECPQALAALKAATDAAPTGILHIGDRITSGPFQRFISTIDGPYLRLSPNPDAVNPGSHVAEVFTEAIPEALQGAAPATAGFALPAFRSPHPEPSSELSPSAPMSRQEAAKAILAALAADDVLYLGNSSAIRVFNRLDWQGQAGRGITVAANRGVSGIEGLVSSAKGFQLGSHKRVVLVLGDISFLYDLGALLDPYLTPKVKIILFNDQKGSIFAGLPGRHHDGFINPLMTTPHQLNFTALLKGFPLACQSASNLGQLQAALSANQDGTGQNALKPSLIEVLLTEV